MIVQAYQFNPGTVRDGSREWGKRAKPVGWDPEPLRYEATTPISPRPNPLLSASTAHLIETDFPVIDCSLIPIVSQRLLSTLLAVEAFPHETFPVTMVDEVSGSRREDYVILQLTTHLDALDHEHSVWEPASAGLAPLLRKAVLKTMRLPPLFRLAVRPYQLYISAPARCAIESAGIRGVSYWDVESAPA